MTVKQLNTGLAVAAVFTALMLLLAALTAQQAKGRSDGTTVLDLSGTSFVASEDVVATTYAINTDGLSVNAEGTFKIAFATDTAADLYIKETKKDGTAVGTWLLLENEAGLTANAAYTSEWVVNPNYYYDFQVGANSDGHLVVLFLPRGQ